MNCESDNLISKGTIVFLAANASYSHTNLAGWYLAGMAELASEAKRVLQGEPTGWSWHEVEIVQNDSISEVMLRILRLNPDIIAASFYLFNYHFLLPFISRYKALKPRCLMIGGGPEFLGDNRRFLERYREINAVIRGEGEQAFAAWLACCRQPKKWRKIKGLCAIIDGNYIDNGKAEIIKNLDEIPSPYGHNLSHRNFKKPFLLLETSRGCSNHCAFCTSAGEQVRFFSVERVKSDLTLMAAGGVTEVRVADRTFNENLPRCIALIKTMRDEFKNIRFHLEIDPARVSAEMIQELSRAEPEKFHLEVGIQTTRSEALRSIGRFGSFERSFTALNQLCSLRNLAIHVDLIAGLPGVTLADLRADLQMIALMQPDEIQLELLKVLPGTQLSRVREKFGIIAANEPPYEVLQTADMGFDDIFAAQRLSRLVDWFYNAPELRQPLSAALKLMPDFFGRFCDFCGQVCKAGQAPALENRFRLLEQFCRLNAPALIPKLGYAWLKWGLSAQHGICRTTHWKRPLPKEAVLVEGNGTAAPQRIYVAELERSYLFVYGQHTKRPACAVYVL